MTRVCRVVTSDSILLKEKEDESRDLFEKWAESKGFRPESYYIGNSLVGIRDAVARLLLGGCRLVIVTGGTGVSPRDVSVEAVRPLADKELPGIGDIHRIVSFNEGVSTAWASRITGFVSGDKLILVIPGNPDALRVLLNIVSNRIEHVLDELSGLRVHRHR